MVKHVKEIFGNVCILGLSFLLMMLIKTQGILNFLMTFIGLLMMGYLPITIITKYREKVLSGEAPTGKLNTSKFNSKVFGIVVITVLPIMLILSIVDFWYNETKSCVGPAYS